MIKVGDKIKFTGEKQRYTVQALDERYIIATKPFNAQKTYLYTIVDLKRGIRGPDNLIFGSFNRYDTKSGAKKNLKDLQSEEMEVSHRRHKKLDGDEIKQFLDNQENK